MSCDKPSAKRRRVEISASQKKDLCVYREEHPGVTQVQLRAHFAKEWGVTVGKSTVSDILKDKAKWLAVPKDRGGVFRAKQPKFQELETCLFSWFSGARAQDLFISDQMLIAKAKAFGRDLDLPEDFAYSRGWLARFKARHGLKAHQAHGEAASAQATSVISGRLQLKEDLPGS